MTCCPNCGYNLSADAPVSTGDWRIDPRQGVFWKGRRVTARQSWVQIMLTLADAGGRVVTTEALLNRISDSESNTLIASQVCQLRKHLASIHAPDPIVSHRHRGMHGYRWEAAA